MPDRIKMVMIGTEPENDRLTLPFPKYDIRLCSKLWIMIESYNQYESDHQK